MEPIRTLNVRFLAWLVASLMLLAGGVFSVHAFQVRRNSGVLKQQAEQAEADLTKASDVLKKVARAVKAKSFETDDQISKISVVGVGMRNHSGVADGFVSNYSAG